MRRVYSSTKRYFENLFNGGLAYFLYKLIYLLSKKSIKSSRRYYELAYKYHFKSGSLIKAYSYKFKQMIFYETSNSTAYKKLAENYLDISNNRELVSLLELNESDKRYLKNRVECNTWKESDDIDDISVLCLGPAYLKSENINFDKYDFIIFNKPLITENFDIPPEKVIVILNNQWSSGVFKNQTIDWIKKGNFSRVYAPNDLFPDDKKTFKFSMDSNYLLASPMGLQRMLYLLILNLNIRDIEVVGYDFQLSPEPYANWYQSGFNYFYSSFYKGWLDSNIQHDFMFNFLCVKKIKEKFQGRVHGSVDIYLEMHIEKVISLFEKKMR